MKNSKYNNHTENEEQKMTNSLFGNNVNEYYVALARKNFEERKKKLDAITTKEQAACYVK